MTSISEVNSEWVAFKLRSDHGFRITRLPDYLSMCFVKAFIILNTSFNYGLWKLVIYSLTTDPATSWVNNSFIIQITTNAKLMEIIHRNIQSIYPAARTVLHICKKLKISHIIIILCWIALSSNYCGYKLLLQTRVLIKLSLLLRYQLIEKLKILLKFCLWFKDETRLLNRVNHINETF